MLISPQLSILEPLNNSSSPTLTPPNLFLWKLILSLDTCSKNIWILLITIRSLIPSLQKKKVSSANCNILTLNLFLPTLTPSSKFMLSICLTKPNNPSATKRNKRGARGSSCLVFLLE